MPTKPNRTYSISTVRLSPATKYSNSKQPVKHNEQFPTFLSQSNQLAVAFVVQGASSLVGPQSPKPPWHLSWVAWRKESRLGQEELLPTEGDLLLHFYQKKAQRKIPVHFTFLPTPIHINTYLPASFNGSTLWLETSEMAQLAFGKHPKAPVAQVQKHHQARRC